MKTRHLLASLIAVPLLATTACNANPAPDTQATGDPFAKGGTLTIPWSASDLSMDPAKSQGLAITSLALVHRRLTTWQVGQGQPSQVVPDLATDTGRVSNNGKTWTYTLKDGIAFEDGTPITSADIKYGIERSFAPELSGGLSYHKTLLAGGPDYSGPYSGKQLDSIETPDDKTIVFQLSRSYGDWPWIASMAAFTPVPKKADSDPAKYGDDPVASGPYSITSYDPGVATVLDRNPAWRPETDSVRTAGPDQVVFKLGQNTTVAAQALIADNAESRNAFGSGFVPPAQLAQAQANPSAKNRLVTSGPGALAYLAINTERPALKDKAVRQALQYGADRQAFLTAAGGPIAGEAATTLITPGIPGRQPYDPYPTPITGDPDKTKQLLAQAGAKDLELTLIVEDDSIQVAQAEALQQGYAKAGVKINIVSLEQNALTARSTQGKGDYDLYLGSWQPDIPSAAGNIQPLFASSEIGNGGYNISRYRNAEVDRRIDAALSELDKDKASAEWVELDKTINADAPVVPLTYTKNTFLHGSGVRNFVIGTFPAYPDYRTVTVTP